MSDTPIRCTACNAPLVAEARFCHRCGHGLPGSGRGERTTWIVAWAAVVLWMGFIAYYVVHRSDAAAGPDMANAGSASAATGAGQPPDISQMSPKERFLRLHDRIMGAASSGDTATVQRFAPMAIAAYGMLDQIDPDLRFHAGAIHIQMGDYAGALALADTIATDAPDHLFATLLRAEVAEAKGDATGARRYRKSFVEHYATEIARGRPEYTEHLALLEEFKQQSEK